MNELERQIEWMLKKCKVGAILRSMLYVMAFQAIMLSLTSGWPRWFMFIYGLEWFVWAIAGMWYVVFLYDYESTPKDGRR